MLLRLTKHREQFKGLKIASFCAGFNSDQYTLTKNYKPLALATGTVHFGISRLECAILCSSKNHACLTYVLRQTQPRVYDCFLSSSVGGDLTLTYASGWHTASKVILVVE